MTTGISRLLLARYDSYVGKIPAISFQSAGRSAAVAVRATAVNTSGPTRTSTSG